MDTPPRSATNCGHIPAGIVEEILQNLPVQSLLRFSSVSISWNLMINEPWFWKKYYRGRKRMILRNPDSGGFKSCHLSAAVSNNPIEEATNLNVFKFDRQTNDIRIRSVCDGLLFLESQISLRLFIWNPSNRKFHKLPLYPFPTAQRWPSITSCEVYYGLGYDLIGDDYKVLRILIYEAALYSLRSNSWRKIQSFPKIDGWSWSSRRSCFVNGALHWLCHNWTGDYLAIATFDFSKEEYGELALPPEYISPIHESDIGDVAVLRGKLCLSRNYMKIEKRFVLWVMEDDGVAESWTKKFDIGYGVFVSKCIAPLLRPLCTCDDDDDDDDDDDEEQEAICVTSHAGESWVILKNKDGNTIVKKNFGRETIYRDCGFVYVESLVSPAGLVTSHENKE